MSSFMHGIVPSIVGPMQYFPTEYAEMGIVDYLTYNWYLCSKHIDAIKKIDETAQDILQDTYIWNKLYHISMIAFEAIPIIGHIAAALELLFNRVETGYTIHYTNPKYRIDTYRNHPNEHAEQLEIGKKIKNILKGKTFIYDLKMEDLLNEYLIFELLKENGSLLSQCPPEIKKDKAAAFIAVNQNINNFHLIDDELKRDISFLLGCLEGENGPQFFTQFVPQHLQDDFGFCLQAVNRNNFVYERLSDDFKKYDQMILESFLIEYHEEAEIFDKVAKIWHSLPKDSKTRPSLIKEILKRNGMVLGELPPEYRDDPEFILLAIGNNYRAYSLISNEKKNDKPFFMKALKMNPAIFQFASADIRKNKPIVLEVLDERGDMLEFVHSDLLPDREVNIRALKGMGIICRVYEHIHPKYRNDKEMAEIVLERDGPSNVKLMGDNLRNDKDFVRKFMKKHPRYSARGLFQYASADLRKDKPFVIEILKLCPYPQDELEHVHDDLKEDPEVLAACKRVKK